MPLLVGKKRVWTDAAGVVSTVVDVIFNPCVLRRCQLNDESGGFDSTYFRNHLATVAKKFVEQDTGLTLSARFIVLKRARYKGGAEEGDNRALPFELPQELQDERLALEQEQRHRHRQEHRERHSDAEGAAAAMAAAAARGGGKGSLVQPVGAAGSCAAEATSEARTAKQTVAGGQKEEKAGQGKGKPKASRSKMNRGFFGSGSDGSAAAVLYPDGSKEGVLPEGAGEPFGWMPKKLRERVQVGQKKRSPRSADHALS